MARKLKVFRTPIGFHDAYVAAPSRKAALAAWGADADLFARGVAEEVTDPALMEAPLDRPGEVVRIARGTADEHLAALPPAKEKAQRDTARARPASRPPARRQRRPRPKRDSLDAAETALAEAVGRFEKAERDLSKRERALAAERQRFDTERRRETAKLTDARDETERRYRTALADWEP